MAAVSSTATASNSFNDACRHVEAPAWMDSARFDIVGTVPPVTPRDQANLMLQNLLADRFQLKLHRSSKDLPIYALVVAKDASKLKVSADDPNARPAVRGRGTILTMGPNGPKRLATADGRLNYRGSVQVAASRS